MIRFYLTLWWFGYHLARGANPLKPKVYWTWSDVWDMAKRDANGM